jgi:hypothetical protein
MNMPRFTAEASLDSIGASYRSRGGFQRSANATVVPAFTECQIVCIGDWREFLLDCNTECFGNSICKTRCYNAYRAGLARCYAQCAIGNA